MRPACCEECALQADIEILFDTKPAQYTYADKQHFRSFLDALNRGEVRAASPDAASPTGWRVNAWVKKGILLGFRMGSVVDMSVGTLTFRDKNTYTTRHFGDTDEVRIVPGGSSVRDGCYIGKGVTCMPPMFINAGAYVDDGTMVDSHALVGSCAQVGRNVHISAASQIGGVLEPVGAMPVIIEDDVLVGGNCGIYEGTVVKRRAVLGTGTILNRSTPLYDLVHGTIHKATDEQPLIIPQGAVIVAGSRAVTSSPGKDWGISIYTPVIVKYRDAKTDTKIQLEDLLR
jgi:2,3,4,5-tetrahydropyridine-2,6-dicarboxylate N-succinyltransferase